jgi:HSP20 family protein
MSGIVARIVLEHRNAGDDLRRVLEWLEDESPSTAGPGECVPPMDVFETEATVEILADLPGVPAESIRVIFTQGVLAIAGHKLPGACEHRDAAFHLAERAFGRFARLFRLTGAFDAGRARATLKGGELHIVLPRIEERRGGEIRIPIDVS